MILSETFKVNQQRMRRQNYQKNMLQKKQHRKERIITFLLISSTSILLFLMLVLVFKSFANEQQEVISNCVNNGHNIDYCIKGVV